MSFPSEPNTTNLEPSLPYLHVTKKPIPRRQNHVEVLNEDLLPPSVRKECTHPAVKARIDVVVLPPLASLRHKLSIDFAREAH